MKKILFVMTSFIICILGGCKFRLLENPEARPYNSIADSKIADVFIDEYQPLLPYLKLGGKVYYIKEAWREHPHTSGNFKDHPIEDSCFVMSLFKNTNKIDSTTDLHSYVKEMGTGNNKIWFFLPWKDCTEDTIVVYYREILESPKKENKFLLVKKK